MRNKYVQVTSTPTSLLNGWRIEGPAFRMLGMSSKKGMVFIEKSAYDEQQALIKELVGKLEESSKSLSSIERSILKREYIVRAAGKLHFSLEKFLEKVKETLDD